MVRPRNVGRYVPFKETPDWEQEEFASRTEIRQAAQAVTDFGERIAELTEKQIASFNLPTELFDAYMLLKKMGKGPALKRQKAFIGKYFRKDEALIIQVKARFQEIESKEKQKNAHFHRLEKWRDRMVAEGDTALNEFLAQYPQADRTQLRQWIRNAQKEAEQSKPAKAAKSIFQYLKALEW